MTRQPYKPLVSAAPAHGYEGHHEHMTRRDYDENIAAGRRFFSTAGIPLPTAPSVRAELQTSGCVVSR